MLPLPSWALKATSLLLTLASVGAAAAYVKDHVRNVSAPLRPHVVRGDALGLGASPAVDAGGTGGYSGMGDGLTDPSVRPTDNSGALTSTYAS